MRRVACTILAVAVFAAFTSSSFAQRPGGPPDRGGDRFNPLIRLFDTDRDGVLSNEEIAEAGKKLAEFDKSGDGKLTGTELRDAVPLGRGPGMGGPGGPPFGPARPAGPGRGVTENALQKEPLAKDDQEERILKALVAMREGPRHRNVSPDDGRLLRLLVETIGAKQVVEIGTSTGESAVWLALALRKTGGHLYTHEIDEPRAKIAQENFKKAGVENIITLVLGDAHEEVRQYKDPIDVLFLDADKEGYIDYLEKLLPLLRPGGLIVAHNMNTRQADPEYLKAITENPELETLILLKEGTGVGVTLKKR